MVFTATLLRNCAIYTQWRHGHRVAGEIEGVRFRYLPNGNYVSDTLDTDQIARLRGNRSVRLEASGRAFPAEDKTIDVAPTPMPEPLFTPPLARETLRLPQPQYPQHRERNKGRR